MRAADYAADRDSAAWGRAGVSPFPLRGLQRPAMGSREDRWREMILRQGYSAPPLLMAFSAHPACRQGRVPHHSNDLCRPPGGTPRLATLCLALGWLPPFG